MSTSVPRNVLVLGAGELGMSILRSFAETQSDVAVTVLLRPATIQAPSPAKQQELDLIREWGVSMLALDIAASTEDELAQAMRGFSLVISCTGFAAGPGTQVKITRAALAANVAKFVPWQFGVDYDRIGRGSAQDLFDEQLDVRGLLRGQRADAATASASASASPSYSSSRTQWKIISTGMFCSFLFEPWFGIVEPQSSGSLAVRALGSWENAVTVTTAEDIGRLTVQIAMSPTTEWDSVSFIAGDTVSYRDVVHLVQRAYPERQIQEEEWTVSTLRQELALDPTNGVKKYRVVFAEGLGVSWDTGSTWNAINGVETTSVGTWLAAHDVLHRS